MVTTMETINIPKDPAVKREWIKYQLRLKGYSLSKLCKEHGVTKSIAVNALIRTYPKWEAIIAATIDLTPQELWPERYGTDGKPINHSPKYPRNNTSKDTLRQRKGGH